MAAAAAAMFAPKKSRTLVSPAPPASPLVLAWTASTKKSGPSRHKKWFVFVFVLLNAIANAILIAIILGGNINSPRLGLPSISAILDDDIRLSIAFGFLVCLFLAIRTVGVVAFQLLRTRAAKLALAFGVLQLASFNMIPVVRVSEFNQLHFWFAALTVAFSVARESCLLFNRYDTKKTKYAWLSPLFVLNWLVIAGMFVCALVYAIGLSADSYIESKRPWAVAEYITFFLIANVVLFELFDDE